MAGPAAFIPAARSNAGLYARRPTYRLIAADEENGSCCSTRRSGRDRLTEQQLAACAPKASAAHGGQFMRSKWVHEGNADCWSEGAVAMGSVAPKQSGYVSRNAPGRSRS
jgi:hypothetical protein